MNRILETFTFCSLLMTSISSYASFGKDSLSLAESIRTGMVFNQPSSKDSLDLDRYEMEQIISISEHFYSALYCQEYLCSVKEVQSLFRKHGERQSRNSKQKVLAHQSIDLDLSILCKKAEKDLAIALERLRVLIGSQEAIGSLVARSSECYFEIDRLIVLSDSYSEKKIEYNHQVSLVRLEKIGQQLASKNLDRQLISRKAKPKDLQISIEGYLKAHQAYLREHLKLRILYVQLLPMMMDK